MRRRVDWAKVAFWMFVPAALWVVIFALVPVRVILLIAALPLCWWIAGALWARAERRRALRFMRPPWIDQDPRALGSNVRVLPTVYDHERRGDFE